MKMRMTVEVVRVFEIFIISLMPKHKSDDNDSFIGAPSSKYSRITEHTKDKLCYIVTTTSLKVNSAAKILKINPSTAKMIIKKYQKLPLDEQIMILERGAKSKKQKSQKYHQVNNPSAKKQKASEQQKASEIKISKDHALDSEAVVKTETERIPESPISEDKKAECPSEYQFMCLYYPLFNFYSIGLSNI